MSVQTVSNIATLRTVTGATDEVAEVLGYYDANDAGGGQFYWDAASTKTDDGGSVIQATGVTSGRWLLNLDSGEVSITQFGAKGDDESFDNTDAIQAAVNTKMNVFIPRGRYKVTDTILLNVYSDLESDGKNWPAPKIRGEGSLLSVIYPYNVVDATNTQLPVFKYEQAADQIYNRLFGYGLEISSIGFLGKEEVASKCSSAISVSGAWNPVFKDITMRFLTGHGITFPFDIRARTVTQGGNTLYDSDYFSNGKAVFERVFSESLSGWGFYFDTGNSAVNMNNCHASSCAGGGLYLLGSASIVTNCSFSYNGRYEVEYDDNTEEYIYTYFGAGIQVGDDYKTNRTGYLQNSYSQQHNCIFTAIELDSNYNRNMIVSGYHMTFRDIRMIQGSLGTAKAYQRDEEGRIVLDENDDPIVLDTATEFNTPIFAQLGIKNSQLFSSRFENFTIRTAVADALLTGTLFADLPDGPPPVNYPTDPSWPRTYCYNIQLKNIMHIRDQPGSSGHNGEIFEGLTYFDFVSAVSRNITCEEVINKFSFKDTPLNTGTSAPTSGYWNVGDIVYNIAVTKTSSSVGWVCVVAGSPGTWNSFGLSYNTATANIGIGDSALASIDTGIRNTALGHEAMENNEASSNCVAIGYKALENATAGSQNTVVGYMALNENLTGSGNVAIGSSAGKLLTGNYNTFIGGFDGTGVTADSNRIVISDGLGTVRLFVDNAGRVGLGSVGTLTDKLQFNGNLNLSTAGNKLKIATGTNASVGVATLASGTVTISTSAVTTNSLIFVTYNTPSGTLAAGLSAPSASIVNGTSFVINSLTTAGAVNITDNSTVRWWIIN